MAGNFNPIPDDKDIVWRQFVDGGKFLAAVDIINGSALQRGWLTVWDGNTLTPIHRVPVPVTTSALFGYDPKSVAVWEEEIDKAVRFPQHRKVQNKI